MDVAYALPVGEANKWLILQHVFVSVRFQAFEVKAAPTAGCAGHSVPVWLLACACLATIVVHV